MKTAKLLGIALVILATGSAAVQAENSMRLKAGSADDALARELLAFHNSIRADLKLPPLQWSDGLAAYSRKWANTLLAKKQFAHNPHSPYGENLFASGIGATPRMVVNQWASEAHDYDFRTNKCSSDCGHYTQLVWRNTLSVGCAVARGVAREVWVCSYDPPGNYRGEWPY
jgi:uncharacterized protein YkwD